jgi:prepilin-type N-terminal cleavage/methylation domain-containing protein
MINRAKSEDGFTLPEVMVAAMILVISILGTATLADVGSQMTSRAEANSAATSIARGVSEAARSLSTTQLAPAAVLDSLKAAAPNLPDSTPGDPAWTIAHRGATYTVSIATCTVDDVTDGYATAASRDSSYCSQPPASTVPDQQPDDYRRITIVVEHARRPTTRVRTFTTISSGATTSLPLITDLKMRVGAGSCAAECKISTQTQTQAVFDAKTVNSPSQVNWLIDGRTKSSCPPATATCTGSGNAWGFTWNIGTVPTDTMQTYSSGATNPNYGHCVRPAGSTYTLDGVYRVGIQGRDRSGTSGGAASLSVLVNRCAPLAPAGLNATGRNANGPVDVEWHENSEGDILGYRVYRGTSTTQKTAVTCAGVGQDPATGVIPIDSGNECLDTAAPAYSTSPLYYGVYAIDKDDQGRLREGAVSFQLVNSGNRPPSTPANFTATKSSTGVVTLTWTMPNTQDPDRGDRIESFRIYRRAGTATGSPALTNRYDRDNVAALCTGTTCRWVDPQSQGSTNSYWLTSVDTFLRESSYTAGRQP